MPSVNTFPDDVFALSSLTGTTFGLTVVKVIVFVSSMATPWLFVIPEKSSVYDVFGSKFVSGFTVKPLKVSLETVMLTGVLLLSFVL